VRIAGSSLSRKKVTVTILDDINQSIQRYMLMLLTTNVMVGVATWIAFRMIGLDNAGAWGVFAGVAHLIPYFGPAVTAALTGMAGFIQFGTFSTALLVAGASLLVATIIGTFVTAWMTGRIAKMNTAGVFISLLFFGWLWGVWGLLLSIPIIVIVKVVSQQVEPLHPLAELLGE
jgi:predicted PurR-regulated permease PerM